MPRVARGTMLAIHTWEENAMGLLDDVMGAALGGGKDSPLGGMLGGMLGGSGAGGFGELLKQFGGEGGQSANLMAALMGLVQQMGGFEGVLQRFQQAGFGELVQSWLSTGGNAALNPAQLQQVFGPEAISQVAQQAGMSAQQAGAAISQLLPELINQFSPQGALAGNHAELLQQGLSMLMGGGRR